MWAMEGTVRLLCVQAYDRVDTNPHIFQVLLSWLRLEPKLGQAVGGITPSHLRH